MVDPVNKLPPELMEIIFSQLSLEDLVSCSSVSRDWYNAANNDHLWRAICIDRGWRDCGRFRNNIDCFGNLKSNIQELNNFPEWKKHFILKNQIRKNWLQGNHQQIKIPLTTEEIASITCVTSSNMLLAYGCNNGDLKVFDLKNECRLIQTIQCKENSPIQKIYISTEYLVFSQDFYLFVFKENGKGSYDFCSMKLIGMDEALEINDPSSYIEENVEKSFSEHVSDNKFDFSQENVLSCVKFVVVEDCLIATNISQSIYVWDLKTTNVKMSHVFELDALKYSDFEDAKVGDICVSNNELYLSVIFKNKVDSDLILLNWYIQAFSLKNYTQVFRSDFFSYTNVTIPELETNDSYVAVSFRDTGHTYIFDRLNGESLFFYCNLVFLNAFPENSDFIGLKNTECLFIYNPKTKCTYFSVDLEGSPLGVFHYVLITVCTEYDRFGKGVPNMEFWCIKSEVYTTDEPLLVLNFENLSTLVFIDETKIVVFVEDEFLCILSFMA